jgi:rfaE bifunctional protein nucleotidyltransferase chain/domain
MAKDASFAPFGALLGVDDAAAWREARRAEGKTVVFTNGCFDVLHAGHVAYLAWARAQGDALILGLNRDESVRELKGDNRPIVPFAERAEVLRALRSVDVVVGFGERTPEVLLERIRPDVHVKSAQYREDELPERTVVLAHGGRIALAPHLPGLSTTDTIARILDAYSANR